MSDDTCLEVKVRRKRARILRELRARPRSVKLVTEALKQGDWTDQRVNVSTPKVSQTRRRAAARCEGGVPGGTHGEDRRCEGRRRENQRQNACSG